MNIGGYMCICEEDAHWLDKIFIKEIERLDLPFAVYFDRCTDETIIKLGHHPLCIGFDYNTNMNLEYDESRKEIPFTRVLNAGFDWAVCLCPDEIYEDDAITKWNEICKMDVDYVQIRWVNMWDDYYHIRVDGPFLSGTRAFTNNLHLNDGRRWKWTSLITHGCIMLSKNNARIDDRYIRMGTSDLVCLHAGLMTHELRLQHKERWDRIYTIGVGRNPYGFWNYALNVPATVVENPYLKRQL